MKDGHIQSDVRQTPQRAQAAGEAAETVRAEP
jgi:hypothetical protein